MTVLRVRVQWGLSKNSTKEVLLLGGLIGLMIMMPGVVLGETTTQGQIEVYQKDGEYYYRYVSQERSNTSAVESSLRPQTRRDTQVVVQERGTYYRGPSSGSRTQAITSRGGEAATQVCGGPLEIANLQGACNGKEYDRDFLHILQTEGLACFRSAGQEAFGFTPTKVKLLTHEGQVSASRRTASGSVSSHAVGRALDLMKVEIYNGAAHNTITMHKDKMNQYGHRTFYFAFGKCWRGVVDQVRGTKAGSRGSGCLDFDYNSAHHDHMHISLPPTDEDRRAYGIAST